MSNLIFNPVELQWFRKEVCVYDFGFEWSDEERKKIIKYAKEVLSSYRVLKRRRKMMLQTPAPDIKSPTFSDMPKSQKLSNSSEDRVIHYLAALEEAEDIKTSIDEIERSINACHGEDGVYISLLKLKYIENKQLYAICNQLNYSDSWLYEKGLDKALCLFAETWDFGRIPREVKNGKIVENAWKKQG